MADGDGTALLLIRHEGIDQAGIAEVLRWRWPGSVVGPVGAESPSWTFTAEDAAELARTRRGVGHLRTVVLAQCAANTGERRRTAVHEPAVPFAPMPIAY